MHDATRSFADALADPDVLSAEPALVLLWSVDEPERAGEVAWLTEDCTLGRAGSLRFVRARPGGETKTGPLMSPRLSREQLRIKVDDDIHVENIGKVPLRLNGWPVQAAPFAPGALLELQGQLLLRCERRVRPMPGDAATATFPFGGPDTFGIVGESPQAWELRRQIAFCGPLQAHVLLHGPSGSGKELVAQALHARSPRARTAMVSRNAATFPETLIEAELFGNVANYPNPGMPARPGLVGAAHGSTLFLDEFGELPQAQQARLLRVLDDGEYTRLGEARPQKASLRMIAATNRPLQVLKADVLARFPLQITLPGLDSRRSDIPSLARHLMRQVVRDEPQLAKFVDATTGEPRMTAALVGTLVSHPYNTHVREVTRLLWESMRRSTGDRLDLWPDYAAQVRAETAAETPISIDPRTIGPEEIKSVLEQHGGKQEGAWQALGLSSRHALGRLMRKHGL